jgi:2-polyprenyl-3-methyl-5-hydroxy-6-metoxy-1,4-benzoquinol methylase
MSAVVKPEVLEDIRCCVCNNSDPQKFSLKYSKEKFEVFTCNNCGLYFIPYYYRKKIEYGNYKDEKVTEAVRKGNNWVKIQRHKLRLKFIRKYKRSGDLFDLGAGWGHFMLAGIEMGYNVSGIEISEQPYLFCRNDLKLSVEHIDFFKMSEEKKFDVITMWDVLEHIDKADDFIEKCSRVTKQDGILVLQVPQIDSYFAKKYKDDWKMMGLDHVNYFSKKTITILLEKYGYKVEKIKSSFELKLFIMYTIFPLLRRLKGTSKAKTTQEANYEIKASERQQYFNKFTNRPMWQLKLFVFAHNIVYNTLSALNIGEEMMVVARKVDSKK